MSRSKKKFAGGTHVCCKSQKRGKQHASRKFRRRATLCLKAGDYDKLPRRSIELTPSYDLGGDGKGVYTFDRHHADYARWLRK